MKVSRELSYPLQARVAARALRYEPTTSAYLLLAGFAVATAVALGWVLP